MDDCFWSKATKSGVNMSDEIVLAIFEIELLVGFGLFTELPPTSPPPPQIMLVQIRVQQFIVTSLTLINHV